MVEEGTALCPLATILGKYGSLCKKYSVCTLGDTCKEQGDVGNNSALLLEGDKNSSSSSTSVVVVIVVIAIPVAFVDNTEEGHIPMANPTTIRIHKSKISTHSCGCFHHGGKGGV